jgi:hypothetical protein
MFDRRTPRILTAATFTLAALAATAPVSPLAAQGGVVITQKTTYNIARVGNGDLTETVTVAGDRMKTKREGRVRFLVFSRDASGTELVRLDEGQVYRIDDRRRQYRVQDLNELRGEIAKSQEEARQAVADTEIEDDSVRIYVETKGFERTGERQTISGFSTERGKIEVTVIAENKQTGEKTPVYYLTADLWIDPSQRAVAQSAQAFHARYVEQLGLDPRAEGNPYGRWLGEIYKGVAGIEGYPIRSTVTMEIAVAEAQRAEAGGQPGAGRVAADPVGAAVGGLMRRAMRPRQESAGTEPGRRVLYTTTTEVQSIAASAPATAEFEVPQGYRKL